MVFPRRLFAIVSRLSASIQHASAQPSNTGWAVEPLEPRTFLSTTGHGLEGTYYNSMTLTKPVLTRLDPQIDFYWGTNAPAPGVPDTHFSVEWIGQVLAPSTSSGQAPKTETYSFITTSDDGVRVWVNGKEIINDWTVHSSKVDTGTIALTAGVKYAIKVDYFQDVAIATCVLDWSAPTIAKEVIPTADLFSTIAVTPTPTPAPTAPGAPSKLALVADTENTAEMQWAASTGGTAVAGYKIYRGTTLAGTAKTGATTFTDTGLTPGTSYSYTVVAYDASGHVSPSSNVLSVTTKPGSAVVSNLTLVAVTQTTAEIEWSAATTGAAAVGYKIYRGTTLAGTVAAGATIFTDTSLTAGTSYTYTVVAYDAEGNVSPASVALAVTTQAADPPIPGTWKLTFDDEFNTLNTNVWTNGEYWYDDNLGTQATFEPQNVSVSNGILSLTANQQPATSQDGTATPYTSGLLQSGGIQGQTNPGFSFTYGYVEMQTKIAPGQGMWSAFYMLPVSHQDNYELDVFENLGRAPTTFQGFDHNWPTFGEQVNYNTGFDMTAGWHTYGVDWEPNSVTWYVDGKAVATYTDTSVIPQQPMYLLMNLDVGGDWAGPLTSASPAQSSWDIDYVKVWQH